MKLNGLVSVPGGRSRMDSLCTETHRDTKVNHSRHRQPMVEKGRKPTAVLTAGHQQTRFKFWLHSFTAGLTLTHSLAALTSSTDCHFLTANTDLHPHLHFTAPSFNPHGCRCQKIRLGICCITRRCCISLRNSSLQTTHHCHPTRNRLATAVVLLAASTTDSKMN